MKVFWLHIPKTGSSFATTIAHASCDLKLPDYVVVKEPGDFFRDYENICPWWRFEKFQQGHYPLPPSSDERLSHVVVMQRRPHSRVLSGYFAEPERLHDCPRMQEKYNCRKGGCGSDIRKEGGSGYMTNPGVIPPVEYANCVGACSAQMLTNIRCGDDTAPNVTLAVEVLNKVGFVGLTGEWELTVCLWHARFGGPIKRAELLNTRPGGSQDMERKEDELLKGWEDAPDMEVYRAAEKRFFRELKRNNVTRESCSRMLSEAGLVPSRKTAFYDED